MSTIFLITDNICLSGFVNLLLFICQKLCVLVLIWAPDANDFHAGFFDYFTIIIIVFLLLLIMIMIMIIIFIVLLFLIIIIFILVLIFVFIFQYLTVSLYFNLHLALSSISSTRIVDSFSERFKVSTLT